MSLFDIDCSQNAFMYTVMIKKVIESIGGKACIVHECILRAMTLDNDKRVRFKRVVTENGKESDEILVNERN